jgi:hypothetical protein
MKLVVLILFLIVSIIYITFCIYVEYHKYLCKLNYDYPFQDPTLPIDIRLDNLMSLLTPEEKVIIKFEYYYIFLSIFKIDMLWMDGGTSGTIL